jgi:hypothetical protein
MKLFVNMALILCTALSSFSTYAQNNKDTAAMRKMITNQQYIFKAQQAIPLGGRTIQLTSEYDVRITRDSVISFLPYYGRAYSAGYGSSEGGIKFNSKQFDYSVNEKKDGWDITIKPKDAQDVQQLQFSIFDNGSASLNVNSTNRQAISFSGYVTAPGGRKKNK